jgi:hypothetical protein
MSARASRTSFSSCCSRPNTISSVPSAASSTSTKSTTSAASPTIPQPRRSPRTPDRDGADAADAKGVAVRRSIRDGLGPHDAARAGTVVDNDRLAQRAFDISRRHPADQIGIAARRVRYDEGDAPARPRIMRARRGGFQRHRKRRREPCKMFHRILLSDSETDKQVLCRWSDGWNFSGLATPRPYPAMSVPMK